MKLKWIGLMLLACVLSGCLEAGLQQRISTLENRIQQNPEDGAAHFELGREWFDGGYYKKAIEHLQQALRLNPQNAETYTLLGISHTRLGEYSDAVTVLGANPERDSARNRLALGSALLGMEQYDVGVKYIKEAVEMDPSLKSVVQTSVQGEASAKMADATMEKSQQEQAMQKALDEIVEDMKEQIRMDVREQLKESLLFGR